MDVEHNNTITDGQMGIVIMIIQDHKKWHIVMCVASGRM